MRDTRNAQSAEGVSQRKAHRKLPVLPRDAQRREHRLAATLGSAARLARSRAGLSQQDVAQGVGIVPEVYGRIERGVTLPSVPTLFRLCVSRRLATSSLRQPGPSAHHAARVDGAPGDDGGNRAERVSRRTGAVARGTAA